MKSSRLLILVLLLLGCTNGQKKEPIIKLKPFAKEYLDLYIDENQSIDPEYHVIFIQCRPDNVAEYSLSIYSDLNNMISYSEYYSDNSACVGYYKKFKVFVFDYREKVLTNCNKIVSKTDFETGNKSIIFYDAPSWTIKIKNDRIIDFSYQFCEPGNAVYKTLKSIDIPLQHPKE